MKDCTQLIHPGLHSVVYKCIKSADEGQREMFANVLLTGGTSKMPGMSARMHKELTAMVNLLLPISSLSLPLLLTLLRLASSSSSPTFLIHTHTHSGIA